MEEHKISFSFSKFFLSSWRPYAWIVALAFLVFFKTLFYEITHFDDEVWLVRYQWLLGDWMNLPKLFVRPDLVTDFLYRPVLAVTFLIDTNIYQGAVWGYRLTNLIFHAINSCLVFLLLSRLRYHRGLTLSFSLIFTVHPVMTMALAWIPGRTELVYGFFILSSFICFLGFLEKSSKACFGAHLLLFLFALLSKETAIALPFAAGLYLYLFNGEKAIPIKKKWVVCSWAILILFWLSLRFVVLKGQTPVPVGVAIESALVNSASIFIQLGKIILPLNLCPTPIIEDTSLMFGLIALGIMSALIALTPRKRMLFFVFGIFWFLIFLLPSLSISLTFYEYRTYIPMLGLIIVLMETLPVQKLAESGKRVFIFTFIGVCFFGALTWHYCDIFKNAWNFQHASAACSPHLPVAHANLGRMYEMMGLIDAAKTRYDKALSIRPTLPKIHRNLGMIYLQEDNLEAAEQAFLKEILLNPRNDDVYVSYALLRYRQDRPEEARELLEEALRVNPDNIGAYYIFIFDYYAQGQGHKASVYIQELERRGINVPPEVLLRNPI